MLFLMPPNMFTGDGGLKQLIASTGTGPLAESLGGSDP